MIEPRQPLTVTATRVEHLTRPPAIPANWVPYVYRGNDTENEGDE
jgi:hypothetical protein